MGQTVDILLDKTGLTVEDVADRTHLTTDRVEAIATGRWTPSPRERDLIARALGVLVQDINWGHTMDPRNIRYHRYGLKEDF